MENFSDESAASSPPAPLVPASDLPTPVSPWGAGLAANQGGLNQANSIPTASTPNNPNKPIQSGPGGQVQHRLESSRLERIDNSATDAVLSETSRTEAPHDGGISTTVDQNDVLDTGDVDTDDSIMVDFAGHDNFVQFARLMARGRLRARLSASKPLKTER